jgi:RNA polymerase sigma-70 factor (ECF subfamily)
VKYEQIALDLYTAHRAALTRYAQRIVANPSQAEDVVQEAWFRLRRAQDPELIRDPLSYFYRVVRNVAVDARRALTRETARSAGPAEIMAMTLADEQPSAEQAAAARSELRTVLDALAELPERTRLAVRLNRIEGRKLREVAERMDISVTWAHALVAEGVAYCDARRNAVPEKSEGSE